MLFQQVNWGRKKQNEGYSGFFLGRGGKMVEGGELICYISNGLVKLCCLNCKILKIQDKKVLPCFKSDQFYYVHY